MGGSHWSDAVYSNSVDAKLRSHGTAFTYDADARSGKVNYKVADKLDPAKIKLDARNIKVRESRDSAAHPRSKAIIVALDVTGSMASVVRTIHSKLPSLMGLLTRKGYVEDPQILFAAVGDATCDRAPLQVGQFESGAEMESDLSNFLLEGGGGGQQTESYELAMYVAARHTSIDCWEKRGERGYLFIIGDEMAYPRVKRDEVQRLMDAGLEADIAIADIVREAQQRYNVFYVLPEDASNGRDSRIISFWEKLLGKEQVLRLPDASAIAELIAMQIGLCEGTTDVDAATADMTAAGSATALVHAAAAGVSKVGGGGAVAKVAPGSLEPSTGGKVERL